MEENKVKTTDELVDGDVQETTTEEKLFTQEEVNKIVKKRLERQKESAINAQELETRAADLTARENKLNCREYLLEKGYPAELLDVIDTSDVEEFKNKADKTNGLYFRMQQSQNVAPLASSDDHYYDAVASAFENTKHEPRKFGKHYNG